MKSIQAYKEFLLEINKNDTNTNVNVSKGQFVLIFNKEARKWLRTKIKEKQDSDEVDDLSDLLIADFELNQLNKTQNSVEFTLPDNHFDYVSSFSNATKKVVFLTADGKQHTVKCDGILYNWNTKPKDINTVLISENDKPSFEFEETPVILSDRSIKVYKTDFDINKVFITYYQNPPEIDIEGYIKVDGSKSKNIDPQFTDTNTEEIISRCAIEVIRSYENPEGFQLAKDRELTEN